MTSPLINPWHAATIHFIQVVEVAGLPEHLLDECDKKANYLACDVTGVCVCGGGGSIVWGG